VEPTLSDDEATTLLGMSALVDRAGYAPPDAAWTPTYDLNIGAAEGWRWKAAAVAGKVDFSADGGSYQRSQQHAMCLAQAQAYARKVAVALPVVSTLVDEAAEQAADWV
jgi:hypothetical protein